MSFCVSHKSLLAGPTDLVHVRVFSSKETVVEQGLSL